MTATAAALVSRLREGVNAHGTSGRLQVQYEEWVARERWPLVPIGVALLVGLDPADWAGHVKTHGEFAATLIAMLLRDLDVAPDGEVDALQLYTWARGQGVDFPQAGAVLFDFIARTLPAKAVPRANVVSPPTMAGDAEERAAILGAALALATRFTERCLDTERMFDSARIVALLRAQSAVWFGEQPPRMDDVAMTALIERHIHG